MKTKILFSITIIVGTLFIILSCMKEEDYLPITGENYINFPDSSDKNPRSYEYQSLLDKYVQKGIPGIVLLIYSPGDGLWVGSSGYACIENKTPMQKNSIVYSASIGKTYCAVATMQLIEEGKMMLDDKINKYLEPGVCNKLPNGNSITIKNLLGHTSGIENFEEGPDFIADVLNDPYSIQTKDIIKYEYNKKALFKPGEGYKYSSTGYELLAKIIDNVTGENHSKYYTSSIFEPLGAENTYYKNEAGFPKPNGLVNSYFDRLGNGKIENVSDINNYITSILTGSDGIMASVYDYYLFIEALVNGKLVSQESFIEMTQWRDTYSWTTNQYGLGLQKRETKYGDKIGHDGDAMGAAADMYYFPDTDIIIVSATNLGTFLESKVVKLYNDDFQKEVLDVVFN